jgi:hypothetical protein
VSELLSSTILIGYALLLLAIAVYFARKLTWPPMNAGHPGITRLFDPKTPDPSAQRVKTITIDVCR